MTMRTPAVERPMARLSTWFVWHAPLIRPGSSVLDLACGHGRHAIAAARLGARVVAIDHDASRLAIGRDAAADAGVAVEWVQADLEGAWPDVGRFDVVLCFNYLARARMNDLRELIAPRGLLMMETFLAGQRRLGWGPTSDDHLLQPGELGTLVKPLMIDRGREVMEPAGGERVRLIASILARRAVP